MAVTRPAAVFCPRGRRVIAPAIATAARGLNTTASAAAQASINTARAGNSARMLMRSRASSAPAIATMRIDNTPSNRSINTDATASTPATPSFERPYARTASPPMLAGRNVPTKVLTKKIRMTVATGGRRPVRSSGASRVHHRYAINTRSITTRPHASAMNRQSAPRAACHTARGSLCHKSTAVSPTATMTRAVRPMTPDRVAVVVFCSPVLVPVSIVVVCTGIVAVIIAGPWALAYIPLFVLATMPGWPLGRALFGTHPAAWVSGALLGYAVTCLAFWVVLAMHVPSAAAFVIAWALATAAIWRFLPRHDPFVALPAWTPLDARILILLLLLVPAVFVFPYKNLGARDTAGNRFYRAYFTAGFVWHTALTAELTKYAMPPVNPYLGDRTIQYYWTYFLVPAVISEEGVGGLKEIEASLKVNALCSGVLFIAALVITTWAASLSAIGTASAIVLAVVAASAEGLYASWDLYSRGRPLEGLRNLNIDAMSSWTFSGLRVDSLVRSMWYNPQHSVSAALGLLAMPIAGAAGVTAPVGAIVLAGVALALSTTFNPFIGGLFSLIYGAVVAVDAVRTRQIKPVLHHAIAAGLVSVAVAWCVTNDMVEGAAGVVLIGLGGYARNRPGATVMLSLGP